MIDIVDKAECCGCAACESACPVSCIEMEADCEGFLYPQVDHARCINCGRCERACPFLNPPREAPVVSAYAARSHNEKLLLSSSSGGIFTELCKLIIAKGGVVYGVAMDKDCRGCSLVRAEGMHGVSRMRGSKYMQADSRGIFEAVTADLREGRKVLFSGTPCQANALARYVEKGAEDLLLVDCVCHGVPSPKLWSESITDLETRTSSSVTSVNFRCKEAAFQRKDDEARYGNETLFMPKDESPYMRMFLRDVCLRESCYACHAKESRAADVTVADFWGIENVLPEMSDELGCSLVVVRTEKGAKALSDIENSIEIQEVSYWDAVSGNPSIHSPASRPTLRDGFFEDLENLGYRSVVRKYGSLSMEELIRQSVKHVLSKLGLLAAINKLRRKKPVNRMHYGIKYTLSMPSSNNMDDKW